MASTRFRRLYNARHGAENWELKRRLCLALSFSRSLFIVEHRNLGDAFIMLGV